MKKGMDFFGTPKRRARVQCHVDGISIPGVGSMRLSNIPKNLWNMCDLLLTLGKKTHSILFYGFALCAVSVRGDCQDPGTSAKENLYLNYTQGGAFLWIKYAKTVDPILPNNTCNFLIAEKQPGNYVFIGCACPLGTNSYDAFLFAQNVTEELINCIQAQLQCSISFFAKIMMGMFVVGICCCTCCSFSLPLIRQVIRLNHRNEEKSLLESTRLLDLKQQSLLNPVLDEDPPTELHTENNSWCCFRR